MQISNCCGACNPTCDKVRESKNKHIVVGLIIALAAIYGYVAYQAF